MSKQAMIEWIDTASYKDLLTKLRFAPVGDPFFQGEVGEHYMEVITRREAEDPAEAVRTSKEIGW